MRQPNFLESANDLLTGSVQIGAQAFSDGVLRPKHTAEDKLRYQGAYSVDQEVVLMVHPVSNPAGAYFPLKVPAGETSLPMLFDEIIEEGTTGVLTDVYVFTC